MADVSDELRNDSMESERPRQTRFDLATHLRPPSPRSAEVNRGQPPKTSEIQYENDPSTSVTEKSPRVRNRLSPTFVTDFVTVAVVTDNLESELSSTRIREIET